MTMHTREEQMKAFGRLLDVLDQLREKCPWDKKQTPESLRPNTIEEAYEPFLIMEGYLDRTPKGRVATPLAWKRLGLSPTSGGFTQQSLFG